MGRIGVWVLLHVLSSGLFSQQKWDGGGGDDQWQNAANWSPDGIPVKGAMVLLDNSMVQDNYVVKLPGGNASVSLSTLHMLPAAGKKITLHLPISNIGSPGLLVTGTGESLWLGEGAEMRNASGASSGESLTLTGFMHIGNGAKYVHNTQRGNAKIIDRLSMSAGTDHGIFEFDVPGGSGYTVSLTGNTFGSLTFSAIAAGGSKSYSGSGASDLLINGNCVIGSGASLTSTMTANIRLKGDLDILGMLTVSPVTTGNTGRSILFADKYPASIKGNGTLTLQKNFRNMELLPGKVMTLERDISLPYAGQQFFNRDSSTLKLGLHVLTGEGSFRNEQGATLEIGSADGITKTGNLGNIRTSSRLFHKDAIYHFTGNDQQMTGDGLPDTIRGLVVDKIQGDLLLSKPTHVSRRLTLSSGNIRSGSETLLSFSGTRITGKKNMYGDSTGGWEKSFVNGPFRWVTTTPGTGEIPVGRDTVFAPVKLVKKDTGYAAYRVEYHNVPFGKSYLVSDPPLEKVSREEYWDIIVDSGSIHTEASLMLSWRRPVDSPATNAWSSRLRIAQYEDRGNGLQWELLGFAPEVIGNGVRGYINSNHPTTQFTPFTLAYSSLNAVLNGTGIKLEAIKRDRTAEIKWLLEGLAMGVECLVERSGSHGEYALIGAFPMHEGRVQQVSSMVDTSPLPGWNHYRVLAIKPEKDTIRSAIRSLYFKGDQNFRIFPNPAGDMIRVIATDPKGIHSAEIIDISGKIKDIIRLNPGEHWEINLRNLVSGKYLLRLWKAGHQIILPFLKK
jgi:hypothetical protein